MEAGSIKLDLVATNATADPLAKCLSSVRVDVAPAAGAAGTCQVTLTPLAADSNFVAGLWSGGASAYASLRACPTAASAPVTAVGGDAGVPAAIAAAFNTTIYGTPVAGAGLTSIDFRSSTPGKVLVNRTSVLLQFAVTSVSKQAASLRQRLRCLACLCT